jgi:hypothetical protein
MPSPHTGTELRDEHSPGMRYQRPILWFHLIASNEMSLCDEIHTASPAVEILVSPTTQRLTAHPRSSLTASVLRLLGPHVEVTRCSDLQTLNASSTSPGLRSTVSSIMGDPTLNPHLGPLHMKIGSYRLALCSSEQNGYILRRRLLRVD